MSFLVCFTFYKVIVDQTFLLLRSIINVSNWITRWKPPTSPGLKTTLGAFHSKIQNDPLIMSLFINVISVDLDEKNPDSPPGNNRGWFLSRYPGVNNPVNTKGDGSTAGSEHLWEMSALLGETVAPRIPRTWNCVKANFSFDVRKHTKAYHW